MIPGSGHLAIVLLQEEAASEYERARDLAQGASELRGSCHESRWSNPARMWQRFAAETSKRARVLAGIEEGEL